MDSTARFLLGGALGAALGYLFSQKNVEKALQSGQVTTPAATPLVTLGTEAAPRTGRVPATPTVAPAVVMAPPVSAPEQRPAPEPLVAAPVWKIPPAPPSDWRPSPHTGPAAPVSGAPVTPVVTPLPEPVVEGPPAAQSSDSEIILTRDFLEEPLPGSGWQSSAALAVEDETLEDTVSAIPDVVISRVGPELGRPPVESRERLAVPTPSEPLLDQTVADLPVVEEPVELPVAEEPVELPVVEQQVTEITGFGPANAEALAEAASVAERLPAVDVPAWGDSTRVDDLKSRIEETRRRIRHELEQPFDTTETVELPEHDWTVSAVAPAVEEIALVEPLAVEPLAMEALAVEPLAVEATSLEPVDVDAVPVEVVPVEPVTLETIPAEPLAFEPVAVDSVAVEPIAAEALPVEAVAVEVPAAEPLTAEPLAAEPLVAEPVAPRPPAAEPVTFEPAVAEPARIEALSAEALDLAVEPAEADAGVSLGLEEPVDYDSMKDRIETTRSRLKAKAFDAMMTGESALLGRDLEGADRGLRKMPGVDSEVDETIETSLREEEE